MKDGQLEESHGHSHSRVDPSIASSARGIWAVKWSFAILFTAASIQLGVVLLSHSVSLLADTIHNFGDAATAIPLAIAFWATSWRPTKTYTYGYGRVEDFAGMLVILLILTSAIVAGYTSIHRLFHPQSVTHLGVLIAASLIGFAANEAVAIFRIRVGKEIGSAALVADGYHARTDGWTSLAVLFSALGVWLGYPIADPLIGFAITIAILVVMWRTVREIFRRALDGVELDVLDEITHAAGHVDGVREVTEVRARWHGHRLLAEVNIAVTPTISVQQAHNIAVEVQGELSEHLPFLARTVVHVDPTGASGEAHHEQTPHHEGHALPHSHHH